MKLLIVLLFIFTYSFAAPAFNKTREFTQADGSTFIAKAGGDRHLNWVQTVDGEILKYNSKSKNFEYAKINNDKLELSGIKYEKNNSKRVRSLGHVNKLKIDDVHELWLKKRKATHK
ncbi:MAG: hypothetical protein COB17_10495 [Sulfurimonas sp.]|nr:MAG: hypothetical protein COB17_10495 [Sulfurimonas sp.]